jgi:hypothetical protein
MWMVIAVLAVGAAIGIVLARKQRGVDALGLPSRRDLIGLALAAAFLAADVYGIENTPRVENGGWWGWIATVLLICGYVGGGLVIGRWWAALVVPLLAILIAVPAGENPAYDGDIPWVAFIYVYLAPVFVVVTGVGVALSKLGGRLRSKRRRTPVTI